MPGNYRNPYQRARLAAGLTQERAAELLEISPESIKAYEGGLRVPPDQTVLRMVEGYDAPELALEHASATDVLGVLGDAPVRPLPLAAIALANRLRAASGMLASLLEIAEDGRIDEDERPVFNEIVEELRSIMTAARQVIYSPESAKKTAPRRQPRSGLLRARALKLNANELYHSRAEKTSPFLRKGVYEDDGTGPDLHADRRGVGDLGRHERAVPPGRGRTQKWFRGQGSLSCAGRGAPKPAPGDGARS